MFEHVIAALVHGSGYERVALAGCSDRTIRRDAIVHHGGAGTAMTALAAGVLYLVLPHNADQPANAEILLRRGVGLSLDPAAARPDEAKEALVRLLSGDPIRGAAEEVRAEISAQPALHTGVDRLEALDA